MNGFSEIKKILGSKVKENEPMSIHTTLQIGGPAKLFVTTRKEDELIHFIELAKKYEIPYLVIGEGSDLLVSDKGINSLVIKVTISGIKTKGKTSLEVYAGENLQDLIDTANSMGFQGMESMAGIPGSVGGAIYGNAGAYGQSISDHVVSIKFVRGGKVRTFKKRGCKFSYRDSIFKSHKGWVILSGEFRFSKGEANELKLKSKEIKQIRSKKYPPGVKCPGSFFKNVLLEEVPARYIKNIPEEKIMFGKIPTGYLMEAVGANGAQKGKVKIAEYHGNLIINTGGGTARDFVDLAFSFGKKVKNKFGIKLEPEVQLIGF